MGNPRINNSIRTQIEHNENILSIASVWETAVKHSISKLNFNVSFAEFVEQQIVITGIPLMPIAIKHILIVSQLPLHHRDSFDRMLIAKAIVESIPIVSADTIFDTYLIQRLW
ncbi:type II toxin-antitoxin system VapC family toxin [Nostoc sp. FACHB-152]|nr:type II toxin-antitoxin system VapC family toxin [Nostoc sp. FACHB-152]MBD2469088.1 type II toxin-antitoxin system VapC family toxin [Nostoc sp. FACHB-145]